MGFDTPAEEPAPPPHTSSSSENQKKQMDEAKLPSLQAPSKLKKITQLLLSVSLFTHTLDKNCIFLLCNGLLVFVAKYSGFISSSSTTPAADDRQSTFSKYEDPAPESKMPEDGSGLVESTAPQEDIAVTKEDEFVSGGSHGRTEDREIEELIWGR
ncbi:TRANSMEMBRANE PROTEIN [Salix koriyanagi]|uniref:TRANSMEMBRANE PROTEIN n=1 Tax=Salix koriyanagi TaxID=2511006 RepID=A0A9Q0WYP9_9ROSI|nr:TRANSMEMBRANE PROTEIN [Salix koriyanagi]